MCTFYTSSFIRQNGHGLYFYLRTSRLDLDDYNKEVEKAVISLYGWNLDEYCYFGECVKNDTLNFFSENPKTMGRIFL
jgi:hypothetical protein